MPRYAQLPNIQPARLDITHYRGDSLSARIRLQSQGVPIDVSKWGWLAYIRTMVDGDYITEFSVLKTLTDGADPANGIIRLLLPYLSAQMLPDKCVWDLQATEYEIDEITPLRVRTVLRGNILTTPDISHQATFTDSFAGGVR